MLSQTIVDTSISGILLSAGFMGANDVAPNFSSAFIPLLIAPAGIFTETQCFSQLNVPSCSSKKALSICTYDLLFYIVQLTLSYPTPYVLFHFKTVRITEIIRITASYIL